jgi:hypothetical protein
VGFLVVAPVIVKCLMSGSWRSSGRSAAGMLMLLRLRLIAVRQLLHTPLTSTRL